jgi:hypothetical protein
VLASIFMTFAIAAGSGPASSPSPAARRIAIIDKPVWVHTPTAAEMRGMTSTREHIVAQPARLVLRCIVGAEGELTACKVISEDPPGYGFSETALSMSRLFRHAVATADGRSFVGGRVDVPLRFELQGGD